jgi:DMSO/TMAO reductase YedYZ heme-binding membrane subunit
MAKKTANHLWTIVLVASIVLILTSALITWRAQGDLLSWVIRELALLGYICVFVSIVSTSYKRQVKEYFGQPFLAVHHVPSVAGLVFLTLHPLGVAWDYMDARVFVPVFWPLSDLLAYGGRVAWYILIIGALVAVWRKSVGKNWKVVHAFNYLAFAFGTVHANRLGANFADWPVRTVSIAMLLVVLALFVRQQLEARQRRARRLAKAGGAKPRVGSRQ